ncbi:MAG: hypothetical protein AAB402_02445 [Patescibacteria group bacterium]
MQTLSLIFSYVGILLWLFGLYLAAFSHLRGILGRAAAVIWQKKYLWLLAFFAGMTAYGGEVNFLFRRLNTVASLQGFLEGVRQAFLGGQVDRFLNATSTLWTNNVGRMTGYLAVTIVIFLVVGWLIIMSQAALVRIVGRGQQGKPTGLVDSLSVGADKFWALVQLNIIGLLVGWAAWVILTAVPAAIFLMNTITAWSVAAYVGSLLSIVISAAVIFLVQFATAGIVLNDAKLMPAIVASWHLFTRNVVASVEMAIAIFTVNLTVSFLILGELMFFVSAFTLGGFLAIVVIIVTLYAILSAFSFSGWTIFYLRLVEGKAGSKLGQWTTQLANFAGQKRAIN